MEEQRQRQEDETRRAAVVSAAEAGVPSPTADGETNTQHSIYSLYTTITLHLQTNHSSITGNQPMPIHHYLSPLSVLEFSLEGDTAYVGLNC